MISENTRWNALVLPLGVVSVRDNGPDSSRGCRTRTRALDDFHQTPLPCLLGIMLAHMIWTRVSTRCSGSVLNHQRPGRRGRAGVPVQVHHPRHYRVRCPSGCCWPLSRRWMASTRSCLVEHHPCDADGVAGQVDHRNLTIGDGFVIVPLEAGQFAPVRIAHGSLIDFASWRSPRIPRC